MKIKKSWVALVGVLTTVVPALAGGPFEEALPGNIQLTRAATECDVDEYEIAGGTNSARNVESLKVVLNFMHTPESLGYVVYEGKSKVPANLKDVEALKQSKDFTEVAGKDVISALDGLINARKAIAANKDKILKKGDFSEAKELKRYKTAKENLITALSLRFGVIHQHNYGCD
jgi:hypothetical protein